MEYLSWSVRERIAVVTLNRPPANALASGLLDELSQMLDQVEGDREVKVILIHGEGRFFSAGADIKEFTKIESDSDFRNLSTNGQKLFDRMENFKKPIIAAIHGAALGGGLELAMACHIRLVTETAKLGLPELTLGLIPGYAGTQRLPRYIGRPRAIEMMLTGEPITGTDAVLLGLANHAYTDEKLMDEAFALAGKIASKSAVSVSYALELSNYAVDSRFEKGVEKEAELFGRVFQSSDASEGIQAFVEKRKPDFKDE
ncbi:enoyl-CoA hydratase [Bacillus marinisedimentorum]|uniref:enoyl-CoA hydratase n=1 Tax=Bacillus marinisedimentorum TaxID=1821260 RepID=UPI0008729934|nr:enoyl-CoA hydratase [Bacillus marinisedimentorum]